MFGRRDDETDKNTVSHNGVEGEETSVGQESDMLSSIQSGIGGTVEEGRQRRAAAIAQNAADSLKSQAKTRERADKKAEIVAEAAAKRAEEQKEIERARAALQDKLEPKIEEQLAEQEEQKEETVVEAVAAEAEVTTDAKIDKDAKASMFNNNPTEGENAVKDSTEITPKKSKRSKKGRTADNERLLNMRNVIMEDMKDALDLSALARLEPEAARTEITSAVKAIANYRNFDTYGGELNRLVNEICDEVQGFGPLEPLLARDDIADIMITGKDQCYIEVNGKVEEYPLHFRDNQHLLNICQRIVSAVGRRVDESSPICDARLLDGSRVNVIAPPLSVDGCSLTIRKFKKDKLTMDDLVGFWLYDA